MRNSLYKKGIVFVIIVLFMGVSYSSAFAVEDKTSTEYLNTDTENENPNPISGVILENSNCYVVGFATDITRLSSDSKDYNICFGAHSDWGDNYESRGFIQTSGSQDEWGYIGRFIGKNGIRTLPDLYDHDIKWDFYIGIKGFRGFVYGGLWARLSYYRTFTGIFIGRADSVKIMTID